MSRHFGVAAENTYGTAVAATDFSEAINESMQMNRESEELTTIRSNSLRQINLLKESVGGDVEFLGNPQELGLLLKHFIGDVTSSGAGPYTHTFPSSGGTSGRSGKSLTVEVQRDSTALTWRYSGCKVTGFGLSVSIDQSPRVRFSFLGKGEATGTAASASYPDWNPMLVQNTTITMDAAEFDCTSFELNCEWPVDTPYVIGGASLSSEPQDNGPLVCEWTAQVLLTDLTEYAKFDGSTDVDVIVAIDDGTHSITINLDKCRILTFPVNVDGRNRLTATITGKSMFNTTATECMQIVLVNDDASIP